MITNETHYYLEMHDPAQLTPARLFDPNLELKQARIACPEWSRYLFLSVGAKWFWDDRLNWAYEQWLDWLNRPGLETWVLYASGTPAGFFELDAKAEGAIEIVYFGLLPQFTGQGFGGHMLTFAVERAWQRGAKRVTVHTTSLDHPAALPNYRKRGFVLDRVEEGTTEIPDHLPPIWTVPEPKKQTSVARA
jgi:GNAT superfamily N-acetyltransferase